MHLAANAAQFSQPQWYPTQVSQQLLLGVLEDQEAKPPHKVLPDPLGFFRRTAKGHRLILNLPVPCTGGWREWGERGQEGDLPFKCLEGLEERQSCTGMLSLPCPTPTSGV